MRLFGRVLGIGCALILWVSPSEASTRVLQVSTGGFSCALLETHQIKCWGPNEAGQLGLGDRMDRGGLPKFNLKDLPPIDLGTDRTALAVAVGSKHACAILDDHSLKCWGDNSLGQLGLEDLRSRGGNPYEMGDALRTVLLGAKRTALAVATGGEHTCVLLDNHSVKCWGSNNEGQTGARDGNTIGSAPGDMGDRLHPIDLGQGRTALSITAGTFHSCALLDDGSIKCWGSNRSGELGTGTFSPQASSDPALIHLSASHKAISLSAGAAHTCAVLDDHSVKCWGWNYNGQLGLGDTLDRGSQPNQMGELLPNVELAEGLGAESVQCGYWHCCAVIQFIHAAKCWGLNSDGILGLGDTVSRGEASGQMGELLPYLDLGKLAAVTQVSTGTVHSCALFLDGTVKCWGNNERGFLGLGDVFPRGNTRATMGDALPKLEF